MVNHIYINQESQTWITINLVGPPPFKIYPYYVFLRNNFELSGPLEKFLKDIPIFEYKFHVSREKNLIVLIHQHTQHCKMDFKMQVIHTTMLHSHQTF